jgi:ComF family protein
LKYRNLKSLAPELAKLMHDYLVKNPIQGDVLVPVPLHRKRRRERGYNQSMLLARELSNLNGLPVVDDCLARVQYTSAQARSTNIDERLDNVAGAFRCAENALRDKHVILIDDVSTSGATLEACATVMKSAGATTVWGMVTALEL